MPEHNEPNWNVEPPAQVEQPRIQPDWPWAQGVVGQVGQAGYGNGLHAQAQAQADWAQQRMVEGLRQVGGFYQGGIIPQPIEVQNFKSEVIEEPNVKVLNTFLIGCDPEFVGFNGAKVVNFQRVHAWRHDGPIGYDHGGWVGEIRPTPSKSAWTVLKRVRKLVMNAKLKEVPEKLRAGAYAKLDDGVRGFVVLGGHVHVDLCPLELVRVKNYGYDEDINPDGHAKFDPEDAIANQGYKYAKYTLEHGLRMRALDCFTARLEALDILPLDESKKRRDADMAGMGYGRWGGFRLAGQGEATRFEYRTMASWLYSPAVAYLCLTGAKLACAKPTETIALLGPKHDMAKLKLMFETFAANDEDAKRCNERVLNNVRWLHADPDRDFRDPWGRFKVAPKQEVV